MYTSTMFDSQLRQREGDPVRVLIVGAGIAGTTAAQLLRRSGIHPVVIDRASGHGSSGYMIALMPMVDAAIDQLDARSAYIESSVPMSQYRVLSHRGKPLRQDALGEVLSAYGDYRGLSRAALLEVLASGDCPVAWGSQVTALDESPDGVHVDIATPNGERAAEFDVVIIADGIHSRTRGFVPGGDAPQKVETGWGGWVIWTDADEDPELGEELWGDGFFVGSYPVKGAVGAFIGGPRSDTTAGPSAFVDRIRSRLKTSTPRLQGVLAAMDGADDPFYWVLEDVRTRHWTTGRTVLLGDAAAGFLPTAGIGAGMAIESAWVLCNTLAGAQPGDVAARLSLYEDAQKPRVESAQSNSRQLARMMFTRSTTLAQLRDIAMHLVSVDVALRPIKRLLDEPAAVPDASAAVD